MKKTPSLAQIRLMNRVAQFNKDHPNWFFCPNDMEWRSAICLYETGFLEPVNCGTREVRVQRREYTICKRVPDTRVKLTDAGHSFLENRNKKP